MVSEESLFCRRHKISDDTKYISTSRHNE